MGIDYPLMSAPVPYGLISLIEDFETQNLDERFSFFFQSWSILHIGRMITSFLREKNQRNKHDADVKFVNKTDRKFNGSISFGRCFGHGVLLVTILQTLKISKFVSERYYR